LSFAIIIFYQVFCFIMSALKSLQMVCGWTEPSNSIYAICEEW